MKGDILMPRKASGAIKVGTVRERQKNGDIYVYERKTKYDPNKKYSDTISKVLIGKIVNGTNDLNLLNFYTLEVAQISHSVTMQQ